MGKNRKKKRKGKKNQKRQRSELIQATTAGPTKRVLFRIDPTTGGLVFGTPMTNEFCQVSYDREKGPKVLSKVPLGSAPLQFNSNRAIWENFDLVLAVDTNTRMIAEHKISVTGLVVCRKVRAPDTFGRIGDAWNFQTPFCLEIVDAQGPPENIGWVKVLQEIGPAGEHRGESRIGMIVDSDFNRLKDYNNRKAPIFANFLLPDQVSLVYASSDGGMEYFANKMIRFADKVSSMCLDEMEAGRIPINTRKIDVGPYRYYRMLVPEQ